MGIAAHSLTTIELSFTSTAGTTVTLTKQMVQNFYQSTSGNAASRRAQTIAWVKDQIVAGLGAAYASVEEIDFLLDDSLEITRCGLSMRAAV